MTGFDFSLLDAPVVRGFRGRALDLDELLRHQRDDECRLIAILGMGGMGKSWIARQFIDAVGDTYDSRVWVTLLNAPSWQDTAHKILRSIDPSVSLDTGAPDELLRGLGVGAGDLALTQGACGGDLLFTESCQAMGARVDWLQPFDEPEFIQRSVVRCGEHWRARYLAARQALHGPPLSAPQVLGPPPDYTDQGYAYERCNLWLLYTALAWGIEKVHFVCLWNGAGGDGRGGTAHMYHEVAQRTGQVHWIDTRTI